MNFNLSPENRSARSFPVERLVTQRKQTGWRRFLVMIFAAVQTSAEMCVEWRKPAGKQQLENRNYTRKNRRAKIKAAAS
jgi:hypothetical protein